MSVTYLSVSAQVSEFSTTGKGLSELLAKLPEKFNMADYEDFRSALLQFGFSELRTNESEKEKDLDVLIELSKSVPDVMFQVDFSNVSDLVFDTVLIINGNIQKETFDIEEIREHVFVDEAKLRYGLNFKNENIRDLFKNHGVALRFTPIEYGESIDGYLTLSVDGGVTRLGNREYVVCDVKATLPRKSRDLRDLTFHSSPKLVYSSFGKDDEEVIETIIAGKLKDFRDGNLLFCDDTEWGIFEFV